MKARVSPVQWSKPNSILAPTQDSNPGGRIQNHKRWPPHYHFLHSHPLFRQLPWHTQFNIFLSHSLPPFLHPPRHQSKVTSRRTSRHLPGGLNSRNSHRRFILRWTSYPSKTNPSSQPIVSPTSPECHQRWNLFGEPGTWWTWRFPRCSSTQFCLCSLNYWLYDYGLSQIFTVWNCCFRDDKLVFMLQWYDMKILWF